MQSKRQSLIEAVLGVLVGLVISTVIIQPIVFSIYNLELNLSDSFGMAVMFTIASMVRSYYFRRFMNWLNHSVDTTKLYQSVKKKLRYFLYNTRV